MSRPVAGAVLVTGTVGVGKTTVADRIGDLLAGRQVPNGVLDLDQLRRCWPAPQDDPFNLAMELRNLAAVAANYRRAGAERLVLAGVLEHRTDLPRYEDAVGTRVTVVRLTAPPSLVETRLRERHRLDPDGLDWHLSRTGELDRILDTAGVEDVHVPVGSREPAAVAADVVAAIGW